MRVRAASTSPKAVADGTEAFLARVITTGVEETTTALKGRLRAAITDSGLPRKLANIVRSQRYPQRGNALDPAGLVYERPNKRSSDAVNLLTVFNAGATIFALRRRWLAIPTSAVQQGKYPGFGARHRVTPRSFEATSGLKLRFVVVSSRLALLVVDNARLSTKGHARRGDPKKPQRSIVCFVLVPSVRLRKRFDWEAEARQALAALPGNIAKNWK